MPTALQFSALALYPGGEGKCGVITHDPRPDGLAWNEYKVEFDTAAIWNLIWNLDGWDLAAHFEVELSVADSEFKHEGRLEISGKGHRLFVDLYSFQDVLETYLIEGDILKGPPQDRVCGLHYKTVKTDADADGPTHEKISQPRLLPSVTASHEESDGLAAFSLSMDIEDGNSNVVGNVGATTAGVVSFASLASEMRFGFLPLFVRLKADGKCDVYFSAQAKAGSRFSPSGDIALSNNNTASPIIVDEQFFEDTGQEGTASAVTFSFFGKTIDAFLWHRGPFDGSEHATSILDVFSLSLAITGATYYTY